MALKLTANILDQPSEPKFRRFRSNNPSISKKLLRCPGGQDLLIALGFRTKVITLQAACTLQAPRPVHLSLTCLLSYL